MLKFDKHIFICTNQRAKDAPRKSCGEAHGLEIVDAFKKKLKEKNLPIKLRAQKAGCLDTCEWGPSMVVYPENIWYGNVQPEDIAEIVQSHLIDGKPVERLKILGK